LLDIKEMVAGRRYETLTLHYILQGFMISECDWLIPPGDSALKQRRVSVTDSLKRRELLEEFLFWYFDSFLFQLLRVCVVNLYSDLG
jgi:telomerase reverse transcriptase